MEMTTKIEWTDETWSPVTGCTAISPGCTNCYAKRMARRLAGRCGYPEAPHHFDVTLRPDRLYQPLRWKKPRKIFVCSMSDLFHEDVPFSFIDRVWRRMSHCSQHIFQILTKRPERMARYVTERWTRDYFPLNIHLGITICNQDELWKADKLLRVPSAVHFASLEPLLSKIDLSKMKVGECRGDETVQSALSSMSFVGRKTHDWVIVGAETGPGKRPMELDWARSLRDQCKDAGTPFFFKKDSDGNHELDGVVYEEFPR